MEIKESRRKEEKRKEDSWRIVADPETKREMWERSSDRGLYYIDSSS